MKRFQQWFAQDLAIDLGTANTLIYDKSSGKIVLNEPSIVAINHPQYYKRHDQKSLNDSVLAVGTEAREMEGRTHDKIKITRPLKDGVIADFEVAEIMLKFFIAQVQSHSLFSRPRIVISVPCESTQVERRAIRDTCLSAGARDVYLVDEPMAVAIGMDLPVSEPIGSMVVDIGGGTTEIGMIALGGLVWSSTLRVAGDLFDQKIKSYVENEYQIEIGTSTSEKIKKLIGTAWSESEEKVLSVRGRDRRGQVRNHRIRSTEIYGVLSTPLSEIINGVREAIRKSPAELSVDVFERGLILAGGGALLRDIDKRFNVDLNIPALIAEEPLTCVVRGCARVLDHSEKLMHTLTS